MLGRQLLEYFGWVFEFTTVQDLINNVVIIVVGIGAVVSIMKLLFSLVHNLTNTKI